MVWKTTTRTRKHGPRQWEQTDVEARRAFGEVFDAAKLTSKTPDRLYWDLRHFELPVYHHLNAALLRQLYGPPVQCVEFNHGCCRKSAPPTNESAPAEAERAAVVAEAVQSMLVAPRDLRTPRAGHGSDVEPLGEAPNEVAREARWGRAHGTRLGRRVARKAAHRWARHAGRL